MLLFGQMEINEKTRDDKQMSVTRIDMIAVIGRVEICFLNFVFERCNLIELLISCVRS